MFKEWIKRNNYVNYTIIRMYFLFNAFMDQFFYNHKKQIVFAFLYVSLQVTQCLFHALLIERGTMLFKRIWWTDATIFEGTFHYLWRLSKMSKSLIHSNNHVTACRHQEFKAGTIVYFHETFGNTWNILSLTFFQDCFEWFILANIHGVALQGTTNWYS